jgi:hypothetical protein
MVVVASASSSYVGSFARSICEIFFTLGRISKRDEKSEGARKRRLKFVQKKRHYLRKQNDEPVLTEDEHLPLFSLYTTRHAPFHLAFDYHDDDAFLRIPSLFHSELVSGDDDTFRDGKR